MNEPLINPLFFYLIDVCCKFGVIATIIAVLSGIFGSVSLLESDTYDDDKRDRCIKFAKRCGCCLATSLLLTIIIPSPTTIYKMMLAQYITKANIIATGEAVDKVLDKAVEKIIKIKESK